MFYNNIILKFINYYVPCITSSHYIKYVLYLLAFSCFHTLALKYRISIKEIFNRFGKPVQIHVKIDGTKTKSCQLLYTTPVLNRIIEKVKAPLCLQGPKGKKNETINKRSSHRISWHGGLELTPQDIEILFQKEDIKDPFNSNF